MTKKEISEMSDEEIAEAITTAVSEANADPQLCGGVYQAGGVYFILGQNDIIEIPDEDGSSPRGGNFPALITGLTDKEHDFFEKIMDEWNFDETFFNIVTEESEGLDWDDEYVEERFQSEGEDEYDTYKRIRDLYDSGETPFTTFNELVIKSKRFCLDRGELYFWFGDACEYFSMIDNINDAGDWRGTYDSLDDSEWLYVLTNLSKYKVMPDEEDFSEE